MTHAKRFTSTRRGMSLIEGLEDRRLFSAFTVTNLLDSGPGSLREAVDTANSTPGADQIDFDGGLKGTIRLQSQLTVTDDLAIDGTGQNKLVLSGDDVTR